MAPGMARGKAPDRACAEIIPFRYLPVHLEGKGTLHVGWDTGDLPSQGKENRERERGGGGDVRIFP
jgi:hypothetical protein